MGLIRRVRKLFEADSPLYVPPPYEGDPSHLAYAVTNSTPVGDSDEEVQLYAPFIQWGYDALNDGWEIVPRVGFATMRCELRKKDSSEYAVISLEHGSGQPTIGLWKYSSGRAVKVTELVDNPKYKKRRWWRRT